MAIDGFCSPYATPWASIGSHCLALLVNLEWTMKRAREADAKRLAALTSALAGMVYKVRSVSTVSVDMCRMMGEIPEDAGHARA